MSNTELELLERFIVDNQDLDELETHLAEFNIFEALGAVKQELRHSDYLSFLLSPLGNHGLGDLFLKRLLKRVLLTAEETPVSAIEIDVADLSDADVRREWRAIDILVHVPKEKLVVLIENKIGSSEHSNQLQRYRLIGDQEFGEDRQIRVFLTPDGIEPSDTSWIPISYSDVAQITDSICRSHHSALGADALALLEHYTAMLRRHIVSDSKIIELCQKIYRRHQAALDLIYEHRPDLQADIAEYLTVLIRDASDHGLRSDSSSKSYIRFFPSEWDDIPALRTSTGWTKSGRLLLFEFWNLSDALSLKLMLGPGEKAVRHLVHETAMSQTKVFSGATKQPGKQYASLFTKRLVGKTELEDAELDEVAAKLEPKWTRFISDDLPRIVEAISKVDWDTVQINS